MMNVSVGYFCHDCNSLPNIMIAVAFGELTLALNQVPLFTVSLGIQNTSELTLQKCQHKCYTVFLASATATIVITSKACSLVHFISKLVLSGAKKCIVLKQEKLNCFSNGDLSSR